MKWTISGCLSLSALLFLGACDNSTSTSSQELVKAQEAQVLIQGATLVRPITDETVIKAMREEYLADEIFAPHLPVTVEAVQIEEFGGFQYLTVIAKDKDGGCVSSSRAYMAQGTAGRSAMDVPNKNYCLNRNCRACSQVYSGGTFTGCSDCGDIVNSDYPGWCEHFFTD